MGRHECKYGCNPNTYKILGNDGFYDCPIHGGLDKKVIDYVSLLKDDTLFKKYSIPKQYRIDLQGYKSKNDISNSLNMYTGANTLTENSKAVETLKNCVLEQISDCSKQVIEESGFYLDIVYLKQQDIDAYEWAYTLLQLAVLEGLKVVPIKSVGWLSELKSDKGSQKVSYIDYVSADLCVVKINNVMNKQNIHFLQDFITDRFFEGKGVVLLSELSKDELEHSRWFDFLFSENNSILSNVNFVGLKEEKQVVKPVPIRNKVKVEDVKVEDIFKLPENPEVEGILEYLG